MKRILLIILSLTLCLPVFSGCGKEPDFFDVVTLFIPTDDQTAQPSNFPAEPPTLYVIAGKKTIDAWRGTFSWFVENGDGTGSGINADSPHPLDCTDRIQAIKVTEKTTLALNFDENPTNITVRRYKLSSSDYDSYDEITVSGNSIEVKAGDYLYEVIANWKNNTKPYNGTVYYAFRTEK